MRAFLYTVVLTAVLIGAIVYLRSLQPEPREEARDEKRPLEIPSRMVVKSDPADPSTIDPSDLEAASSDALYQTGVEILDLWHLPEAIEVFETMAKNDSTHLRAYLRLIECYSHPMVGHEKRARESFEAAFAIASERGGDTLMISGLGDLLIDHNASAAIDKFLVLSDRDPDDDTMLLFLAKAMLLEGDAEKAAGYAQGLLTRDQTHGRARELLIQCYVAQGRFEDAAEHARDLATMYSEEPYPYVIFSRVELIRDNVAAAVDFGNNALAIDERYIPAIVNRAHLYLAEGEPEAARVSFEKLLLFDDPMLAAVGMEGIAYIGFLSGRFDEARDDMNEAIRLAMNAGSTRRGLVYAFRLVNYLCELGRPDVAELVLDRWVSRHGKIPAQLGMIRIGISAGDFTRARQVLNRVQKEDDWRRWMRAVEMDFVDTKALTLISEERFDKALDFMEGQEDAYIGTRRSYLKGFALFQSGEAEQASDLFTEARVRLHSLQFPYHDDPILYVQSLFFLGETAIASGAAELARSHYEDFLEMWGESTWDLQAVGRARQKLETLSAMPEG